MKTSCKSGCAGSHRRSVCPPVEAASSLHTICQQMAREGSKQSTYAGCALYTLQIDTPYIHNTYPELAYSTSHNKGIPALELVYVCLVTLDEFLYHDSVHMGRLQSFSRSDGKWKRTPG